MSTSAMAAVLLIHESAATLVHTKSLRATSAMTAVAVAALATNAVVVTAMTGAMRILQENPARDEKASRRGVGRTAGTR